MTAIDIAREVVNEIQSDLSAIVEESSDVDEIHAQFEAAKTVLSILNGETPIASLD